MKKNPLSFLYGGRNAQACKRGKGNIRKKLTRLTFNRKPFDINF